MWLYFKGSFENLPRIIWQKSESLWLRQTLTKWMWFSMSYYFIKEMTQVFNWIWVWKGFIIEWGRRSLPMLESKIVWIYFDLLLFTPNGFNRKIKNSFYRFQHFGHFVLVLVLNLWNYIGFNNSQIIFIFIWCKNLFLITFWIVVISWSVIFHNNGQYLKKGHKS